MNRSLEHFVEAVEAVRKERVTALDEAGRRKIAEELGFEEADLRAAAEAGEAELQRGEGFLRHGLARQALESLRRAHALLPDRADVLVALARAAERAGQDREATQAARRCIELAPRDDGAFEVLAAIERKRGRRSIRGLRAGLLTVVFALGSAGGVLAATLGQRTGKLEAVAPEPLAPVSVSSAPLPADPVAPTASSPGKEPEGTEFWAGSYVCTNSPSLDRAGCDVALGSGDVSLSLDTSQPLVRTQYDGERVTLIGSLRVRPGSELSSASAELVQIDAFGRELDRTVVKLLASFEPTLRATDTHTFHVAERAKPGLARARLRLTQRSATPAPVSYPAAAPLAVRVGVPASTDLALGVAARRLDGKSLDGEASLEGVLAVTNRGPRALRGLVFDVVCLDPAGAERDKSSVTPVYSHMPPMLPGEVRAVSFSCFAKGRLGAKPSIRVTEVEE